MFKSLDISTSGLVAQRVRMNTCATNLANIDSVTSPEGGPYKRRSVIFEAGMEGGNSGEGVKVASIEKQDTYRYEYDPANPYADARGYVKLPGIDPFVETVNMMEAQRAYEANLAAAEVSKSMLQSSLRLLA
ncbi:MAG: flagellar basal body rod protein FlgC [Sedimentisphaerales bacterium]|nr:flagellar basal body rod protein FlgC [Sedimentisphaerales bacterium]MBN2841720.1 flagellar basal body rod protein FlgC [Sedimentisphaerales bacterium]